MKGNSIIVEAVPKGKFIEGIVSGTPVPGTLMTIKAAVATIGGRHTWEAYNPTSDGDPRQITVLLEDHLQGGIGGTNAGLVTTAYVSGARCFLYVPYPGEEMNVLVKDIGGTGDTHAIGDRFIGEHASGKLIAQTNSANVAPFVALEAIAAPTADTLMWMMRS